MIINVKPIKENLKIISSVIADFIYIDVEDKSLYVSTDKQAIKLNLDISDISDAEKDKKVFTISKGDFIHTIEFANETIKLTDSYRYEIEDKNVKGKFEYNDEYANVLTSIKVMFEHEDEYTPFMVMTDGLLNKLARGSIFVDPSSINASNKYLDIKENKIFSSSDMRIYVSDIDIDAEGIMPSDVLKYIQNFGIGCVVKNNNNSYLISDSENKMSMYISTEMNVDYLPVLSDKFKERMAQTEDKTMITIDCKDFADKLNYMSFYAQKSPSNLGFITIENEKMYLSTDDENKVEVKISTINDTEKELDEFKIPCNLVSILTIISKLGKDVENIRLFASKDNNFKLFMIKFGDTDESVILAKLNV